MIKTVAHFADIHVPKSLERHEEYKKVLKQVYNKLEQQKPDRIVIAGDTYNDYIDLEGEALILIGELLNKFSSISPVIITRGNHEIRKKNRSRIDTIRTVTDLLQNPRVTYYDKSGFYKDDNVVWVVWDHVEHRYNGINPWKNIADARNKNLTYIDIYHDPIQNCVYHGGYNPGNREFPSPSDFKGDYSFFGDIHLRQFFNKKTKGYCGSLIQQTFGEEPFGHGYLLWNIEDGSVQNIDIENEHRFIKFDITPNTDYDKLHLISKHVSKYNKFKVDWNEYAAFITNDNENKIRKYLKDKYDAVDIEIKPNRIYTDLKGGKMLSETLDINNKEIQQDIIKEYLKENKYDDNFINQIIEIDNTINDRLHLVDAKNIIWNIDEFWFDNFKSYGEDNRINWKNVNGIIQIAGENQQGKTTIIDAICFILYGVTLATTKPEKNGNNRYINKNRNKNYCDGAAVIDVNGEKYIMHRKVEREFKKGREIKSVPMILDYYKGTEMSEENKLTGERRTSTQKLLDEVLGDFDDFIRMSLTNADNLNSLLSMDRSVFIDSIIRDAGYDVFEKKLNEFKEYKKELNLDKINVNQLDLESEIKRINEDLYDKKDYLSDTQRDINDIDNNIISKTRVKDGLLIKLHKIDESIISINIDDINNKIYENSKLKEDIINKIDEIGLDINKLPSDFDENNYDKLSNQYDKYLQEKNKRDIELIQLNNIYKQNEDKINNVDKDINIEKTKYLDYVKNNIASLRVESREMVNEIQHNSLNKKSSFDSTKNKIKIELNNLKQSALDEKQNIEKFNNMLNGVNQICPTCNQLITNKDEEHINGLISESKRNLEGIAKTAKEKLESLNEVNSKLEALDSVTNKLIDEKTNEYNDKMKVFQNKIDNFDIAFIQDRIQEIINNKGVAEIENRDLKIKIEERKKYLERLETETKRLSLTLNNLKVNKALYDKYKDLIHQKERLNSQYKDYDRNILDNNKLIDEYKKNEILIKENNDINNKLNLLKIEIEELNNKKKELLDNKLLYSNDITLSEKVLKDLNEKLEKYIKQEKLEEMHGAYLKLMHRTGLPTYLLTKNVDILNDELNSLLTNINFTLFFDEDLNLKLQHDGLNDIINVIESSGMERTFSALVLKMVLRVINFKSKPNFMFLDEVINRLVNKSVDKFMELLEVLREKIDKLIVIEQNNEIVSDMIINVIKSDDGISKFEII